MKPVRIFLFAILLCVFNACSHYQVLSIEGENLVVSGEDTTLQYLIIPYRAQLADAMEEQIGFLEPDLFKKKPEGGLGNLVTNILLDQSTSLFSTPADFVVYNYGGLRIDQIYAGPVTRGKIFELLPFENYAVMLTLDGNSTARLLEKIAREGGWPVAGLSMVIENGEPRQVMVRGLPFDANRSYRVVMNDYMANGGDALDFLPGKEMDNSGVLIRDIVLRYIVSKHDEGKTISVPIDNRITVAE